MINFKSTIPKYNPKIPVKLDRPRCEHAACDKARVISNTNKDGTPAYSRWCRSHFNKRYYDGKSAVRTTAEKLRLRPSAYVERAAIIRGFSSLSAYARFLKENPVPAQATINTPSTKLQQIRSRIKI